MAPLILCDTNVWLALVLDKHGHFHETNAWFENLDASEWLFFCRPTQQGFLRLLTHGGLMRQYGMPPLRNRDAIQLYRQLMSSGRMSFHAEEPPGTEALWMQFAARNTASPKLWMDAYLAAFAIAGGFTFATFDGGFRQFQNLELLLLGS